MTADKSKFQTTLDQFNPEDNVKTRMLSIFSSAITFDDTELTEKAIKRAIEFQIDHSELYEIILQSYLFLGFPRMLQAADVLNNVMPHAQKKILKDDFLSNNNISDLYKDGEVICEKVYKNKFEPLKERVLEFAPEIFHWMILEGYGKVLSRDQISIVIRELSIISFLTMENRKRQLHSHILGALNVGASKELIKTVIDDIGLSAGDGYHIALSIIDNIKD